MTLLILWSRLRSMLARRHADGDLQHDIDAHLDLLAAEHERRGLSTRAARTAARRDFGGVMQMRETHRDQRGWPTLDAAIHDLRHATRSLTSTPGFTATTLVTLAVAIGAATTVFTLIDTLLWRRLPVPKPEQLVHISLVNRAGQQRGLSVRMLTEIQERQQIFSGLFGYSPGSVSTLEVDGRPTPINLWAVSGTFHTELGQTPHVGRLITPADAGTAAGEIARVAVLGHAFWQRRFGGDRSTVGRTVDIEGQPFTVIGVTRKGFGGMGLGEEADVTIPLFALNETPTMSTQSASVLFLDLVGRLNAGATLAQARAHLNAIWPGLLDAVVPPNYRGDQRDAFMALKPVAESAATGIEFFLRSNFTRPLYLLAAIVAMLLAIACVHLASLMLSRAAARSHELSVRIALGASRSRVARSMLTESVLLALAGAALGVPLASWSSQWLSRFMTQQYAVTPTFDFTPNMRSASVTLALALMTGVLFGLASVWFSLRRDPAVVLQRTARAGGTGTRVGTVLIASQIALSLGVLSAAGLLTRSLRNAQAVDVGFETRRVTIATLQPRPGGYEDLSHASYYRELIERVTAVPGVRSASLLNTRPGSAWTMTDRVGLASTTLADGSPTVLMVPGMGPGVFGSLGIDLMRGRDFAWIDTADRPAVALINHSLADTLFPSGDALGQFIQVGGGSGKPQLEVIGIVEDARIFDPRVAPQPSVYMAALQDVRYMYGPELVVRADNDPRTVINAVEREIDALGREFVFRTRTLDTIVGQTLVVERLLVRLGTLLAAVALLLAAIGLHGIVAYGVARRTREIGLRMALGAGRPRVVWTMARHALVSVALGVLVGIPIALAAGRVLAGVLFEVAPFDPVAIGGAAAVLIATAVAAAYLPARKASRVDPMIALRCD